MDTRMDATCSRRFDHPPCPRMVRSGEGAADKGELTSLLLILTPKHTASLAAETDREHRI